jgi:ankyrin repeat protein
MTEEERIKEEIRLQKECNELYFKHVLDKKYDEVKKILNEGAEIDYMNEYGLSSLHICCSNGDFKMLEYLLKEYKERGLDINASKKGYRYPVYTHALTATMCKLFLSISLTLFTIHSNYSSIYHGRKLGGNGCTQQFLDALLAAGAKLPEKSKAKSLETELFEEWNLKVEEIEKQKRLEKARGRRTKKNKKKKKKGSKSRSPSTDKSKKKKKKDKKKDKN